MALGQQWASLRAEHGLADHQSHRVGRQVDRGVARRSTEDAGVRREVEHAPGAAHAGSAGVLERERVRRPVGRRIADRSRGVDHARVRGGRGTRTPDARLGGSSGKRRHTTRPSLRAERVVPGIDERDQDREPARHRPRTRRPEIGRGRRSGDERVGRRRRQRFDVLVERRRRAAPGRPGGLDRRRRGWALARSGGHGRGDGRGGGARRRRDGLTGSPLHATASTASAVAHIARRMSGSLSAPT